MSTPHGLAAQEESGPWLTRRTPGHQGAEPTATAIDGDDAAELYELLERASHILDRLWNESRDLQAQHLSMQLGKASHSLHRTLLALRHGE